MTEFIHIQDRKTKISSPFITFQFIVINQKPSSINGGPQNVNSS